MAKPFNNFEWATDPNYTTGPDVGTPTKVAPSAGERDEGFVPDTAAVPQYMNYLFGEIADWLLYLAGLAGDAEFLGGLKAWIEGENWNFDNNVVITADLSVQDISASTLETAGLVEVGGALHALNNADVDGNLNVDGTLTVAGVTTFNGDVVLGASDNITMASRTVRIAIPLTSFSPLLNTGHTAIATLPPLAQSYVGAGQGGYGLHFYEASGYGGDRGITAASLNSGNLQAGAIEFVIPRGATLTGIRVGFRQANVGGGANMYMEFMSFEHNSVSIFNETTQGTKLQNSPGVDSSWALTGLSVATAVTTTPGSGHRFSLRFQASSGSDSFDSDLISYLEATYTTTHVDTND